jgi:hypothetical protein
MFLQPRGDHFYIRFLNSYFQNETFDFFIGCCQFISIAIQKPGGGRNRRSLISVNKNMVLRKRLHENGRSTMNAQIKFFPRERRARPFAE